MQVDYSKVPWDVYRVFHIYRPMLRHLSWIQPDTEYLAELLELRREMCINVDRVDGRDNVELAEDICTLCKEIRRIRRLMK